jgi:hypothetical protein
VKHTKKIQSKFYLCTLKKPANWLINRAVGGLIFSVDWSKTNILLDIALIKLKHKQIFYRHSGAAFDNK